MQKGDTGLKNLQPVSLGGNALRTASTEKISPKRPMRGWGKNVADAFLFMITNNKLIKVSFTFGIVASVFKVVI